MINVAGVCLKVKRWKERQYEFFLHTECVSVCLPEGPEMFLSATFLCYDLGIRSVLPTGAMTPACHLSFKKVGVSN